MSDDPRHLFAYGTLRRGAEMHGLLERETALVGAPGSARAPGCLYDLGAFPGFVPAERADDVVHGDLFTLPEADPVRETLLDTLDRYEGRSFERVAVDVAGPDGAVRAWVYVYRGDLTRGRRVTGGDLMAERGSRG